MVTELNHNVPLTTEGQRDLFTFFHFSAPSAERDPQNTFSFMQVGLQTTVTEDEDWKVSQTQAKKFISNSKAD